MFLIYAVNDEVYVWSVIIDPPHGNCGIEKGRFVDINGNGKRNGRQHGVVSVARNRRNKKNSYCE
jgi:hypothetical protein